MNVLLAVMPNAAGVSDPRFRAAVGADSLPNFPAVDGNICTGLKTQEDSAAKNLEHRDFEEALGTTTVSNHNGFMVFPR
jgi:hypothetical protein